MRTLTAGQRRQFIVLYRTGAGVAREPFRSIGAALQRAEFIERAEACPVYLQHGYHGKPVRCVS